eukprot:gnl/Chilomastix_caulleri/5358.p1 GENE.gnl/Chilomastix_caulleri/5358~~gnl/Chilomastix_caulleri/5358.p1  ORF type:complete len:64 (+),score=15.61 gnl/Chilomastix_caulleri/5358:209-400(+)
MPDVSLHKEHIAVGDQVVTPPNFLVRVDSERHIRFAENSPFGTSGKKGRVKPRRNILQPVTNK